MKTGMIFQSRCREGHRGRAHTLRVARRLARGFTMIEIALSLAVISFALLAIIGVLPFGMSVQRENRQETIINQDATVFMEALRNGVEGADDLTNYVMAITNFVIHYNAAGQNPTPYPDANFEWYTNSGTTPLGSWAIPTARGTVRMPLTNGTRIIGLLGTPKILVDDTRPGFFSNHVVAYVRSMSGPASEKFPQTNAAMQELGLSYRIIAEVIPVRLPDPWDGVVPPSTSTNELAARNAYWTVARNVQTNLHELRLTFRWPETSTGLGNGRQVYRTMVSGALLATNDFGFPIGATNLLFFFEPQTYVKAP